MEKNLKEHKWISGLINCAVISFTLIGCLYLLEYSILYPKGIGSVTSFVFTGSFGILNLFTLGILLMILVVLSNRLWLSCMLCSIICGCISIINYYVITLHGMPLSFLLVKNFKTAMNVLSSYTLKIDHVVASLLVGMALMVGMCFLYYILVAKPVRNSNSHVTRNAILVVLSVLVFYWGYLSPHTVKPKNTIGWSWEPPYYQYGYVACTVESLFQVFTPIEKPEKYSQESMDIVSREDVGNQTVQYDKPDIILILNESFYDLRLITDPDTDIPFLSNIESMENLLSGYAVAPGSCGGTNTSEYELLTSNSTQLMPGVTPFNSLELEGANSIVSHLNKLGYNTQAAHYAPSINYSRGTAYPALGFHTSYFEKQFEDTSTYYYRWSPSDESLYQNLFRWYEEIPSDSPRFQFLLTIQNHGGWEQNDNQYDIVHTLQDYGTNTYIINEFLTGIYQSDAAFKLLTEHYSTINRPVIICMVGDHAPAFASDIANTCLSEEERDIRLRMMPLLIWANYPLEEQDLGTMSMNMVVPTLLEIANVELSPYYRKMLQIKEQIPVLAAGTKYCDVKGNYHYYENDDGSLYADIVDSYFGMVYQNIATNHNRDFYLPEVTK